MMLWIVLIMQIETRLWWNLFYEVTCIFFFFATYVRDMHFRSLAKSTVYLSLSETMRLKSVKCVAYLCFI
jgi:hypothetical protein